MKKILVLSLILLLGYVAKSQQMFDNTGLLPVNPSRSIVFGKDIVVDNQPDQNQDNVVLCSAFNGWLFAAHTYIYELYNAAALTILKSTDQGITWTVFFDYFYLGANTKFSSIDIVTLGSSISDLKVVISFVVQYGVTGLGEGYVTAFNGETGEVASYLFGSGWIYDIALSSDFLYPPMGANPNSLGILVAKHTFDGDSIVFMSSSNGGISIDNTRRIAATGNFYHKVSLAYGKTSSYPSGRYFAVWEEQDDLGPIPGRIYTAHSEPNFNSSFTTPVNLDGIDPSDNNTCSSPVIACSYNGADNGNSNITEIVLFDRYDENNQKFDIRGYYNLQAASSAQFTKLNLVDTLHQTLQPNVSFNPFDSTFIVTYFDSTNSKLPYIINDYNLVNPDNWEVISQGYNDSSNLSYPKPKVEVDIIGQSGANVWRGTRAGGNGITLFDAQYSTYTGINETSLMSNSSLIKVYPNPCVSTVTIEFETHTIENIDITLFDLPGRPVRKVCNQKFTDGKHKLGADLSDLPAGSYSCIMRIGNMIVASKIVTIQR